MTTNKLCLLKNKEVYHPRIKIGIIVYTNNNRRNKLELLNQPMKQKVYKKITLVVKLTNNKKKKIKITFLVMQPRIL